MSSSYTYTATDTFTRTHAKRISYRVAADLKRLQRLYDAPSNQDIEHYEAELIELLRAGYLNTIRYGFVRHDRWIEPTLVYTAFDLAGGSLGDDPGRIQPEANVVGAGFQSSLTYTLSWHQLSRQEQEAFEQTVPIKRVLGIELGIDGYMQQDLSYSAGGRGLQRATIRSWTS